MNIVFIATNYNNSDHTKKMCESINAFANKVPIIIVDNNSNQNDVSKLVEIEKLYSNLKVVYNSENIGYFSGLNIGIEYAKKNFNSDILVVGNNDLVFNPNFLDSLIHKSYLFDSYAIISPNIITLDNIPQNPHVIHKISRVRHLILDLYYSNFYISKLIDNILYQTKNLFRRKDFLEFNKGQVIYQGYGACYIIGPKFFTFYNKLFSPTFLMGEEFFLAYQLKLSNLELYYEPSIKVYHQDHASVSLINSYKFWKISKSSHKIYKKYLKSYE
jgi:GT2 family glycosyltransferase